MVVRDESKSSAKPLRLTDKLSHNWTMWAHLPHDTDWTLDSYKKIHTIDNVGDGISLIESMSDNLVKNCMLFLMREGVTPVWEDVQNRNGGCFSYKIINKSVYKCWKELSYVVLGGSISTHASFVSSVSGITISPKKNFCIIKIWMSSCTNQDPSVVTKSVSDLDIPGCLFKKHVPEY